MLKMLMILFTLTITVAPRPFKIITERSRRMPVCEFIKFFLLRKRCNSWVITEEKILKSIHYNTHMIFFGFYYKALTYLMGLYL